MCRAHDQFKLREGKESGPGKGKKEKNIRLLE